MASKFSSPKPSGSIFAWQPAQAAWVACRANCSRKVFASPFIPSSIWLTPGGGGGGGVPSTTSRTYLPRSVGLVRFVCEVNASTAAMPSRPPRFGSAGETFRNSGPLTFLIP